MTATIDEQAVQAFIELAEKATPGPWELNATKSNQLTATPEEGRFGGPAGRMRGDFTGTNYITNLAFIAAARNIAPALAAWYLERTPENWEQLESMYKGAELRAEAAEARVAELTALLEGSGPKENWCCADPKIYYANMVMHYCCASCHELWHRKPVWADQENGQYWVPAL